MKKIRSALLIIFATALMAVSLCIGVSADTEGAASGTVIDETVNLINANKNQRGSGYFWDNPNDTLTITNMKIDTASSYGLRFPDGARLVLEGDNVIKASYCALSTEGNLTVEGKGTLTLISDTYGIIISSSDMNKTLSFYSGSVVINAGGDGIFSENAIVTQNKGADIDITAGAESYAVNTRQIKLLGGEFTSNAPLYARDIKISEMKLSITANRAAISIKDAAEDKPYEDLSMSKISIKAGDSEDALSSVDSYNGENCISTKIKNEYTATSLFLEIFGVKAPGYLDFIFIGIIIIAVAAIIATPYIKHKMSLAEVEAKKAAAREEEKQNRKATLGDKNEEKK